ncbi:hypothetical protein JAAARDRAFT_61589 [Jaapia argillacea MUCL 33604]|uniref:Uncharacterized protein n=1 Tax=Jaapia argillacea MUCL 33604 TaxID=933084 RepID=A0A067PE48_9AGAM|nr:hypothetical protein JAAARDRAFT_61589 [Jaapia argillacea MUCL 33604]
MALVASPTAYKFAGLRLDDDEESVSDADRLSAFYPNAGYDFYGTRSGALCVYKTGLAWPVRTGPESQRIIREARGVHGHPMQPTWPELGRRVCDMLDGKNVLWASMDCLAFAEAGQKRFSPLLIWIGVEPKSLSYELANTVADAITYFINVAGFSGFEIGFRESVVSHSRGPKMLSFDPLNDSVPEFREPFAPTLGIFIAPLKTPHYEGTGALYLREGGGSKRRFLLTCAHVARPPPVHPNTGLARKKTTLPREHVIVLGSSAYTNALKRMMGAIADQHRSIKDWEAVLGESEKVTDRRKEHLDLVKKAKAKIVEIDTFHNEILKLWTIPEQRVIGEVVHVEPIAVNVAPHGLTRDWALIELYDDQFDWSTFKGNKVYIGGNLSSLDYGKIMFPHPEDQANYEYPEDGLLQAFGVIQPEEIRNPKQLDANGEECLLVVKHGLTTGTTIGRVTGMESFTRNFNEYGTKETSMEIAVLPYGNINGPFSGPGDSGSIVLDRKGRILGMLNGGAGSSDKIDITYLTPYSYIEKDIKKYFPESFLYEVVDRVRGITLKLLTT